MRSSASTWSEQLALCPTTTPRTPFAERRARGLFADMRFTMARPEVSCHPELLVDGARTVIAAARCYAADVPPTPPDHGRLPRYTWRDEYAILREQLEALGRRLGGRVPRARRRQRPRGSGRPRFEPASRSTARTRWRSPPPWLMGRPRGRRHGGRDRAESRAPARLRRVPTLHRRMPDGCPRRAGDPRLHEMPLVLESGASADPRCVPRARWATWSTAATSVRTSVRGIAASRSDDAAKRFRSMRPRWCRSPNGSIAIRASSSRSSTGSTFRRTTDGGCVAMP